MKLLLIMAFIVVGTLVAIGPPGARRAPPMEAQEVSPPSLVRANGFTLVSTAVELPIDDAPYPEGPGADVINAHCTSCHSASMALTQPRLDAEKWAGIVHKMRDVYKAPVDDQDAARIITYLTRYSETLPPS